MTDVVSEIDCLVNEKCDVKVAGVKVLAYP